MFICGWLLGRNGIKKSVYQRYRQPPVSPSLGGILISGDTPDPLAERPPSQAEQAEPAQ